MEDREERTIREEKETKDFYKKHPEFRPNTNPSKERGERFGGKRTIPNLESVDQLNLGQPLWKNTSMEQRETRQRVERIVETLSETRQDLLRRYYWEQQTLQEIATDYGITYQAVQQRLDTARGAFSRALTKMAEAGELNLVEEEGI